jgi:hypothetical protein
VALGMSAGLNIGTEDRHMEKIEISPNIFPRISAGYSADGWSIGLSFILNRTYLPHHIIFDTGYAEMRFIKRLDTTPKTFMARKFSY